MGLDKQLDIPQEHRFHYGHIILFRCRLQCPAINASYAVDKEFDVREVWSNIFVSQFHTALQIPGQKSRIFMRVPPSRQLELSSSKMTSSEDEWTPSHINSRYRTKQSDSPRIVRAHVIPLNLSPLIVPDPTTGRPILYNLH